MICQFCRATILSSGQNWGHHQGDKTTLRASAQEGCIFCAKVLPHVQTVDVKGTNDKPRSCYWWVVRQAPQIRESAGYVTVAFHAVEEQPSLPDLTFYLLPEEEGNKGQTGSRNHVGASTDSRSSWAQVKRWVEDCNTKHVKCATATKRNIFIPSRVLDVGSSSAKWPPDSVRVVNTKEEHVLAPYVTLSHCWGLKQFAELTEETLGEYRGRGVPWHEVCRNKNLEHAIKVARQLHIRYLWMDSLCIIQRQGDLMDWHAEAPLMHQVYRNSYCNIAAVDSKDCDGGLFREREKDLNAIVPSRYTPEQDDHTLFRGQSWQVVPGHALRQGLLDKVLYSRAWVFQERMLSQRILHFSANEIFWDCSTVSACESFPEGLPQALDTAATDRHWRERLRSTEVAVGPLVGPANDSLEAFWRAAVRTYTSCSLTQHKDKLAAIWGIAKLTRDALGEEYACGLWSENLHEQLAWKVVDNTTAKGQTEGFPSWSWASTQGATIEVANRVPEIERFYSVTDHERQPLSIALSRPVYRKRTTDTQSDWKQELHNMTTQLNSMELKRKGTNDSNMSGTKSQVDQREALVRSDSSYVESYEVRKDPRDSPPELQQSSIEMQGFKGQATIFRTGSEETSSWSLEIDGVTQSDAEIWAFPDTPPPQAREQCRFLILAASKDEFRYDDELRYSGTGILVEHAGGDRFRRTGAWGFGELDEESWMHLRWAVGQREDLLNEELNVQDGSKFWLI